MNDAHIGAAADVRRLLAAVLDASSDAIIARDLAGTILLWSPGAERLYGYSAQEMVGESISRLIPADAMDDFRGSLAAISSGARVDPHDAIRITKRGEQVHVSLSVSPIRDASGRVVAACVVARDITARRHAERGRQASDARWRAIVDSAVDGIIVIDSRGRIESFNPAAERLFGYGNHEVVGGNVSLLMPEPYASQHDGYLTRYHATREPHVIGIGREVTGRRKDGSTFPAHLAVAELAIEGEQRFTGIVRDLTDRVKLEAKLREEAGLVRLGELAAVLAHEVKNPLAAVSGAIQVLSERLDAPEEREIAEEILRRLDALSAMMGDILLYARPPAPKLRPVRLVDLLESLVGFMRLDHGWQHIDVQVEGAAPSVLADGELLKVAFQNLFVNAVQAMGGHGVLRIAVRERDGQAVVDVTDSGPGIPASIQAKLFTPFFTTKASGTGLGLPTVRRIADAHHGSVEIFSSGPDGTTVRFALPRLTHAIGSAPLD